MKLPESKIESSDGLRTPQANSIALQDRTSLQQTSKEAQALLLRGDGRPRGELLQRSSSTSASLDVVTKLLESKIECSDGPRTHQVPLNGSSPHPRKSNLFSTSTGLGRGSENSEAAAARQLERENLSAAKAKAPRVRSSQRKNSINSVTTPSLHPPIV